MKNKWLWGTLALILVSSALYIFKLKQKNEKIVHPHRGDLVEAVYGLGRVKTDKRFEVIIGVLTSVSDLSVDEGQNIKKGDKLITFDTGSSFRSPIDGMVTFVKVRTNETATPNTVLMRIEDLKTRYVELSLDQDAALRIKVGQKAKVSFETLRENFLTGEVRSIYSRNDEFIAHVYVDGLSPNILPGMTADVTIEVGKINNALLVPVSAIHGGVITVRRNGKWVKEKIELGYVDGSYGEVIGQNLTEENELRIQADR